MLTQKETETIKQMITVEISYLEDQIEERSARGAYVTEMQNRKTELEKILVKLSCTESDQE